MVIIPASLLSSADVAVDLTHTRILYEDHTGELASTAVSASDTADDSAADAPMRPDTYEFWQPATLPATYEVNLGRLIDADAIGVLGTFGSSRAALLVETSIDGGTYVEWGEQMPSNDAPILLLNDEMPITRVRLTLTGSGDLPKLFVVKPGKALAMQRACYGGHTPMNLGDQTVLSNRLSKGGQFLGQSFISLGQAGSIKFSHLKADWMRSEFDLFKKAQRGRPYFIAWRPETFPLEVAYAWTDGEISVSNMGKKDFMSASWSMYGWGYE